ncbi:hypothetical protein GCM10020220_038420 [Nonomuraea rubra]|uniref:hypothetical protein n=1 Tax=Nonomuraea rubra TaxID=46180 RepID=UPI0031E792B7
MPTCTPSHADPRWGAQAQLAKCRRHGACTFYTHAEIGFFLLKNRPEPGQRPEPIDSGGYFDHTPHSSGHDFRRQGDH